MALTAVQVYKYLPKKNCGECGVPTCLAFAMQLVQKKTSLDKCPYVTDEGRASLEGASAPPIRLVTVGAGDHKVAIGQETVLFRHDETFYHQPGIAIRVTDDLDDAALKQRLDAIAKLTFVRVGQDICADMVAVEDVAGSADAFAKTVKAVCDALPHALVLVATKPESLAAALAVCADRRPLIHAMSVESGEKVAELAKQHKCPLAVKPPLANGEIDLEKAAEMCHTIASGGVEDLVIDATGATAGATLQTLTKVRRAALRKSFRPLGYPMIVFTGTADPHAEPAEAGAYVAKYAGVIVMNAVASWQVLPVLTVRQNLYTDPRKPIQVEPGLYPVGTPDKNSPLLITTNFSLTYYTVEGEIEASRVAAYIGVIDTEGTSVLTAYASDKLTPEKVTTLLNSDAVKEKVDHKKVIIPGYIAVMSGKLEDESGWKVLVGPREASGIPKYLRELGSAG